MNNAWLMRLPVGLFAVPVGLFALAGAWRRAEAFGWEIALPISSALGELSAVLLALLMTLYAAKAIRHTSNVSAEFTHPLIGSLFALIPLSLMLCSVHFGQAHNTGWLTFTLLALTLQGVIALRVVALLATGKLHAVAVTPALYLPPVAGGFVGALAMHSLGYPGWAGLLFGMGLASWALLEARVLNSLFEGPLPEALRPTIGVELAPPSVATLVAASLWPSLPGEVLIVGLGVAAGPLVAVMARWSWWSKVPFSIGFWSFSFPVGALAGAVIEVVRRGHWPALVGGIALAMASSVILFLAVRTVILALQGRLLPSAPVQRS
jgi:tellurite resistance protein